MPIYKRFFICVLIKTYEILSQLQLLAKFPVIQHVLFGSILEFKKIAPGTILPTARLGMLPPRRIPTASPSAATTEPAA